jgi:D-methionine transport system permease protein
MGGSAVTVVRKALLPEALPALVSAVTTTVIVLIGYSAMAGTVGGGGLGTLAINYGYMRFETTFMWVIAAELIVLVTLVQLLGEGLARRLDHKRGGSGRRGFVLPRRAARQTSVAPRAAEPPAREPELSGTPAR